MLDPAKFPRPPLLEKVFKRIIIRPASSAIKTDDSDDTTSHIVDTATSYRVLETYHPPTYYLPLSSLSSETYKLTKTSKTSYCEWKGEATYFTLTYPSGEKVENRIWCYENPTSPFKEIKDYISFYASAGDGAEKGWDCFVDGEKVVAQPGDFYGGWMTSDIKVENVKGRAGTRHW